MKEHDLGPTVTDMPRASVVEGGSIAEMELKNSDGTIQLLRFAPDIMMKFLNRVFELFLNQKIQKESSQGYAVVQPFQATTTSAQEDIEGKTIIMQFRLSSGLPAAFSVQPSEAEILHKQLGKAIKKSRKHSLRSVH